MNGVGFLNLMNASVRIPCQKSGSDRIIKFRGIVRIPSLPLRVLTHSLHAWETESDAICQPPFRRLFIGFSQMHYD